MYEDGEERLTGQVGFMRVVYFKHFPVIREYFLVTIKIATSKFCVTFILVDNS